MRTILALVLAALAACTSTTDVLPMGRDTYMVTGTSEYSASSAQQLAVSKANRFAEKQGKKVVALSSKAHQSSGIGFFSDTMNTHEFQFRLVGEDDPEWKRNGAQPSTDYAVDVNSRAQAASSPQASDLYTELQKLRGLLDDGTLTQEEFDQLKAKLIAGS